MFTNYTDFIRYLAAKKTIDDRSLNTHVFHTFTKNINELYSDVAIHILEAGCGIGSMIERMFTGGILSKAFYTAIDLDPEYIAEAARRLVRRGFKEEMQSQKGWETILSMHGSSNETRVILQTGDVMKFTRNNDVYHLILAHAFLDLVDIYSFLPQILSHVSPGGLAYFTLNFDGVTSLEPTIEADLDRHIIAAYHETMDHRLIYGKSSGDSQTGRHLLPLLHKIGLNILDAGASDWIIFPQNSSYLDDDAYFLHFVVDTIYHALEFCPTLNPEQLRSWTDTRHRQVDKGELFYIAHQLDVLCQIP